MAGVITEIKIVEGITMKVKDKNGLVIADRIVSDKEEVSFVDESDRQGNKLKTVKDNQEVSR